MQKNESQNAPLTPKKEKKTIMPSEAANSSHSPRQLSRQKSAANPRTTLLRHSDAKRAQSAKSRSSGMISDVY